jgi:tRNA A-37 threonylcarbamoyl transferase component Bud32
MAQSNWTYHGASGRSYQVGLYHGDDSGHVIIYCNNNILTIDFGVNEEKSYSFYLEQDLCELSLNETDEGYAYDFSIAEAAPTPEVRCS